MKRLFIMSLVFVILSTTIIYGATNSNTKSVTISAEDIFNSIRIKSKNENINIEEEINTNDLLMQDLSIGTNKGSAPKILIIHSHPKEQYAMNVEGKQGSIVQVGTRLKEILEEKYDVKVFHLQSDSDLKGSLEVEVKQVLKKNPSIEVIIDMHRDGGIKPTAITIHNEMMAKININNGLCIDSEIGTIGSLKEYPNPYIYDNLSLSIQTKILGDTLYPNLVNKINLLSYRYSSYMLPKSLIVDIGNNMDTMESAQNSLEPFAEMLAGVLNIRERRRRN